jgi:hypothetical protein
MRPNEQSRQEAIRRILGLRRLEGTADADARGELRRTRELLESIVGPTIRPSEAARLLGVSQPALKRWLDVGEIAGVLMPDGRREIPLRELLDLLDEIGQLGDDAGARPLARVMRERRRRSEETIDLERLLPRRHRSRGHRTAELQALAYHRLIAERLDESMVDDARDRLRAWHEEGRIHPRWAREWGQLLSKPLPQIARTIGADSQRGRELRQTSPFPGVLNQQERRRLTEEVEKRARA